MTNDDTSGNPPARKASPDNALAQESPAEQDKTTNFDSPRCLRGGGEMGALMRQTEWETTPVGRPEHWPQSLKTTVRLVLSSQHPMFIWWGPQLTQFYNDAYRQTMGLEKHPAALAGSGYDWWPEAWPIIGPQIESVMAGNAATWHEDQPVPIRRHGSEEMVYWTYGFSPIDDEAAPHGTGGVLVVCRDVTEEHRLRQALVAEHEDERRRRLIIESATDYAIVAADRDGRITDWNTGAERILGWSAAEIRGEPLACFFTPKDQAEDRPGIEMRLAVETGYANDERWHQKKDGTQFWASGEMMPLKDELDNHLGFIKILRDRTEHRRAEKVLREAQSLNTLILNSSRDCIIVLDLDGRTRFVSPGGVEVMEMPDADTGLALPWLQMWQGADREVAAMALNEARSGGTGRFHGFCPTYQGTPKWWDVMISPLPGPDGAPEQLVSVGRDITKRKQAEAMLHELNASLEERVEERTRERNMVWRTSRDLFVICGFDGFYRDVNPAWTEALGYTPDELIGQPFDALAHPDDAVATKAQYARLVEGKIIRDFDIRVRAKDGSYRWYSWHGIPEGNEFYAAGRDITERNHLEEQLRQSQKMEAVGQLTGGLAHDFNNLLTAISGSLELLQARLTQGRLENVGHHIATAQSAAGRAASLTQRLLAFSRRQTLDPKPIDPNKLIMEMEELIQRTAGRTIMVELMLAAGLWPALCDASQLDNALLNLCINARDAMPDGGRLRIETANIWLDEPGGRERDMPQGEYVEICVSDTGIGMTPEVAAKAFDPFFTTKPVGQGTGLGLSMVYGFAKQSGGGMRILLEPGHGTAMRIYLPRHWEEAEKPEASPQHAGLPHAGVPGAAAGETILVVEDEAPIRMLVIETLKTLGYTTIEAADGATGLALLRSDKRVDLLISDIGLPGGMDGRQMATEARQVRPALKVLFITGYAADASPGNRRLPPDTHIMTKPFEMEALAIRVKNIFHRSGKDG